VKDTSRVSWSVARKNKTSLQVVQLLFLCLKNGTWTGRAEVTKKMKLYKKRMNLYRRTTAGLPDTNA